MSLGKLIAPCVQATTPKQRGKFMALGIEAAKDGNNKKAAMFFGLAKKTAIKTSCKPKTRELQKKAAEIGISLNSKRKTKAGNTIFAYQTLKTKTGLKRAKAAKSKANSRYNKKLSKKYGLIEDVKSVSKAVKKTNTAKKVRAAKVKAVKAVKKQAKVMQSKALDMIAAARLSGLHGYPSCGCSI